MVLGRVQRSVARGMATGLGVTFLVLVLVPVMWSRGVGHDSLEARFEWLSLALLLPAATLAFAIARLAGHRFFTPQDMDGSALTAGTDRARLLQSLLQNTLEQVALALPVYFAWAMFAPGRLLPTLPAAGCLFLLGRLLFFRGYVHGAAARALGFALTFYPTLVLVLALAGEVAWMAIGG